MSSVDELARLLQAVAVQNWAGARSAGERIADTEERRGHHTAAQRLRGALVPNGRRAGPSEQVPGESLGDPGLLSSALARLNGSARLSELELRPTLRKELDGVLGEWRHQEALRARGLAPRKKLLFHGPPGCGKSVTALAIGNELAVPTFLVRLESVVGSYLGQTALRMRELFRFAEHTDCVLLIDEVDALGKRRGGDQEVGELDRVAIALMQMLEHSVPRGMLIATSNLAGMIDSAVLRRFDQVLSFPRPSESELKRFAARRAAVREIINNRTAQRVVRGVRDFAHAERRILAAERAQLLTQLGEVT